MQERRYLLLVQEIRVSALSTEIMLRFALTPSVAHDLCADYVEHGVGML